MAKIKRYDFNSHRAYRDSGIMYWSNTVAVIKERGWIKADISTKCKRWQTAVRRFFSVLPECADWQEEVFESIKNGYWKDRDYLLGDGSRNPNPSYSWEVENLGDDQWYIYFDVREDRA